MKIKNAKIQFERLRQDILADRIVDWKETEELLKFIETYVQAGVKPFVGFAEVLQNCRRDGKITADESKILAEWIDKAYDYLDREDRIDSALLLISTLTIMSWVVWLLIKAFA